MDNCMLPVSHHRRLTIIRILFAIGLLFPTVLFSSPLLSQLLSNEIHSNESVVLFKKQSGNINAITSIKIHFLKGRDCYSGYLNGYAAPSSDHAFPVTNDRVFALTARGLYQAAQSVIGTDNLADAHSALIRIISTENGDKYKQYAHFAGGCQDEGINCCIAIDCSETLGICLPLVDIGIQTIYWM